jgi:hypothetical protein
MVGIGGVVAVLGTLGKESKDIFKKYKKDKCTLTQLVVPCTIYVGKLIVHVHHKINVE